MGFASIQLFTSSVTNQNPPLIHFCFIDSAHPFSKLLQVCARSLRLSKNILPVWDFEVIEVFYEQESWWASIYLLTEIQSVLRFTGRWLVTCWSNPLNHIEDKIATNTQHKLYWIILCNFESFIIVVERTLSLLKEKEAWRTNYRMAKDKTLIFFFFWWKIMETIVLRVNFLKDLLEVEN